MESCMDHRQAIVLTQLFSPKHIFLDFSSMLNSYDMYMYKQNYTRYITFTNKLTYTKHFFLYQLLLYQQLLKRTR